MSCVEVYIFKANGDAEHFGDARNAWGFGFHVWEKLAPRYGVKFGVMAFLNPDALKPLWDIATRKDASRRDRIMMSATFDRTWVRKANLPELIEALDSFIKEASSQTLIELHTLLVEANKLDILGVGFNGNSISCSYWDPIKIGSEDSDDFRPFNLNTDLTNQVELFGVFDKD